MVSDDAVAGGSDGSENRSELSIRRKTDNFQLHELTVTVFPTFRSISEHFILNLWVRLRGNRIIRMQKMCRIHKIGISIYSFITSTKTTWKIAFRLVFFFLTKSVLPSAAPSRAVSIESISDDWLHSAKIDCTHNFTDFHRTIL